MRTRTRLIGALAIFAAFVVTAGEKEPTYNGHSLSEWVAQFDPHVAYLASQPPAYIVAIGHIGKNALPILLKWMAEKDPLEPPNSNSLPR
jgi:hypothetical protein